MGWAASPTGPSAWMGAALMVALWVAVVALAVWLLMRATRTAHQPASTLLPPRGILDRRFLTGEIDAPTYARARRALEGEPVPSGTVARRRVDG
jgi:putative membrane protein